MKPRSSVYGVDGVGLVIGEVSMLDLDVDTEQFRDHDERVKAIEYDAYGSIDRLTSREVPPPEPRAREVLVRVIRAALNPKDALFRKGKFRTLSGGGFPKRCGLDFAGEVLESRDRALSRGDRVFGMLQEWRFSRGTLAEQVTARTEEIARLPENVSFEAGAGIALAGLTSLQALRDVAAITPGARVLVHGGSGGVGTAAIQIAKQLGATVVSTSSARNVELCARLGATALDYAGDDPGHHGPFDCIYDVFGNLRASRYRAWLAPRGIFVSTVPTTARVAREAFLRVLPLRLEQRLVVVSPRRRDLETLAAWLAAGEIETVIDSRHGWDDIAGAFAILESKRTRGKLIIEVE